MENSLELGDPVVVELHVHGDLPTWWKNFVRSDFPQDSPLDRAVVVRYDQEEQKSIFVFQNQHHYTMFLLKWS